ncbi:MAG: aspartate dehydrogenase [ANME-2 cluster archaeon]|nr:aspartate dehydrogenase [ANME-2 cluster archaeon]MDF1556879.1 aspartate dehydrogenase [ANME-2 cluster archaeon]
MLKVGVVGCGAIGSIICRALDKDIDGAQLFAIHEHHRENIESLYAELSNKPKLMKISEMVTNVDLVVESASAVAVHQAAIPALENGCDVMIMSVGALVDRHLLDNLIDLAREHDSRIYLPSGAVAGIDGIKSAAVAPIRSVTLTTTKPPRGLAGAPYVVTNNIDLDSFDQPQIIFEGTAIEAVKAFPANVNVAACISLAGIGVDRTRVKIMVDPGSDRNRHEIEVIGDFGTFTTSVENIPFPENPRTSYLAALSAVATLKKIASPLQIGT